MTRTESRPVTRFADPDGLEEPTAPRLLDVRLSLLAGEPALDQTTGEYSSGVCATLASLIVETQAQSGKHLSVAQANTILSDANRIRKVLSC